MEQALEISFWVLGVVFVLGLLMVLLLIKDVFFHGRFRTYLPAVKHVPTSALDAAREALLRLQAAHQAAAGEQREALAYEIRHLDLRIAALEDKTYTDQSDYYDAARTRERVWREWRALHEESRGGGFRMRRQARDRLEELRIEFRKRDHDVDEEYHRAVARDTLTLEELHSQGVLNPEAMRQQAPPATTAPPTPAAEHAEPPGDATGGAEVAPPAAPAQSPGRGSKWTTPLVPYPPAEGGLLAQSDLALPDIPKSGRTYVEATLTMAGLPGGMLDGVDFSRSSFAEVEFVGLQRFLRCNFVATDLRRIEMQRAEAGHVFQDCELPGASLAQARLSGVLFRRCNLSGTHWRSARLDRVRFEECTTENVHWEGVDLSRTVVSEDMLARTDFSSASKLPLNLRPTGDTPQEPSSSAPPHEPPGIDAAEPGAPPGEATPAEATAAPGPEPADGSDAAADSLVNPATAADVAAAADAAALEPRTDPPAQRVPEPNSPEKRPPSPPDPTQPARKG